MDRVDPLTGDRVRIVAGRQARPNLPDDGCPFCPGGLEAPSPYDVLAFANRWPPLPAGHAEILLYTPRHDASFADLDAVEARRVVDLWAERSAALGSLSDVAYVLVFENRGAEVGATISHPHGQVYAFADVPPRPLRELREGDAGAALGPDASGTRLVATADGGWRAWVPAAPAWPFELVVAPERQLPDLPSLSDVERDGLGRLLVDLVARLDRLFAHTPRTAAAMPYMLWFHQRPFDDGEWPSAWLHAHLAPLLRDAGTARFVAAGELGSGVWFNPVDPDDAARRLREA
jgi:UDPglucose--hexose-1-phosphate uridylyltransferase